MARRASTVDAEEPDRIEGFPHPRESGGLWGQDEALARAARMIRGTRPPQALLLTGPPGIGKATLAYRIARYLLCFGAGEGGSADLLVPDNSDAARQVMARAHPGLTVVTRGLSKSTGKLMKELGVDEIRRLASFFGMTSGAGGWRVAIIDSADDMNDNAANALLKMLEEPPGNALLLLISHAPGRLLPTIRSRCQRLELRALDDAMVEQGLKAHLPDMPASERLQLVRLSGGSIGAALILAAGEGAELAGEAERLIDNAAAPDILALMTLGERLWRIRDGLSQFGGFFTEALAARIRARAVNGDNAEPWLRLLTRLEQNFGRSVGLNLEPKQTLLSTAREMAAVARGSRGI